MRCPNCGSFNTQVRNCRRYEPQFADNRIVWRRRKCAECRHKWTTYEVDADRFARVIELEMREEEME